MKKLKLRYQLLSCLAVWLFATAAAAAGVEQMNVFLKDLQDLKAGFEQSVLNPSEGQATRSQGTFYLKRPGRFRWDYTEPENQQIIADGENIWMIEPDLEQVSVQEQTEALRGTPALFLVMGDQVDKHFEVIDIGSSQGFEWVELIPRDKESQFVRILLAFADNQLQRMEMTDTFGQISRFQFYDIEHNPTFKQGLFVYKRPAFFDLYRN